MFLRYWRWIGETARSVDRLRGGERPVDVAALRDRDHLRIDVAITRVGESRSKRRAGRGMSEAG